MKLLTAGLFACTCLSAFGQAPSACPVKLDHLDLRYNHAEGKSVPQVSVGFTNESAKRVAHLTFSLSILDSGGYPRPYDENFTYSKPVEPGRHVAFLWTLNAESVDMHHTGESVSLDKIEFADGTVWTDDGSLNCTMTIDFHAK